MSEGRQQTIGEFGRVLGCFSRALDALVDAVRASVERCEFGVGSTVGVSGVFDVVEVCDVWMPGGVMWCVYGDQDVEVKLRWLGVDVVGAGALWGSYPHGVIRENLVGFLAGCGIGVPEAAWDDLAIAAHSLRAITGGPSARVVRYRQLALLGDLAMWTTWFMLASGRMDRPDGFRVDVVGRDEGKFLSRRLTLLGHRSGLFSHVVADMGEDLVEACAGADVVRAIIGVLAVHVSAVAVRDFMSELNFFSWQLG